MSPARAVQRSLFFRDKIMYKDSIEIVSATVIRFVSFSSHLVQDNFVSFFVVIYCETITDLLLLAAFHCLFC